MNRVRVLVVEDSLTVRRRLCEILHGDSQVEVVGEASDGKQAIELCESLRPDVVTLDMMLPVMTGLTATEYIMAYFPTPILVVSGSTNRGELFRTYDALAAGAVDVLEKPTGEEVDDAWDRRFLAAVKLVAKIKVITHPRARLAALGRTVGPQATAGTAAAAFHPKLVAIGASTGGPGAMVELLLAIPPPLRFPIVFVLHIDEPFGAAFADWLDAQSPHRVRYARHREPLDGIGGRVVMAPPRTHLVIRDGMLELTSDPERHSCRPSIDVLFESLARELGRRTLACLLTGMGRDGAAGLLAIRGAGGHTIAQDEASSVVYGMPREAVALGAASEVLSLAAIGPRIAELLRGRPT